MPSIDADIDKCIPLTGQERTDCWTALDKKLMEEIVAAGGADGRARRRRSLGPAVTQYDFDQFGIELSLARVAVDPSQQN